MRTNVDWTKAKTEIERLGALLWLVLVGALVIIGISIGIALLNMPSDLAVLAGVVVLVLMTAPGLYLTRRFVAFVRRCLGPLLLLSIAVLTAGCYKIIPPGHAGITVQQTGTARGVSDIPVQTGRVF